MEEFTRETGSRVNVLAGSQLHANVINLGSLRYIQINLKDSGYAAMHSVIAHWARHDRLSIAQMLSPLSPPRDSFRWRSIRGVDICVDHAGECGGIGFREAVLRMWLPRLK